MLLAGAAKLKHPQVLMLTMTHDELFVKADAYVFFDAIPGPKKRSNSRAARHPNMTCS